jgi:hypothetical protein
MERSLNKQTDRQTEQTDKEAGRQKDRQKKQTGRHACADKQTAIQKGRQTYRWRDGQTD